MLNLHNSKDIISVINTNIIHVSGIMTFKVVQCGRFSPNWLKNKLNATSHKQFSICKDCVCSLFYVRNVSSIDQRALTLLLLFSSVNCHPSIRPSHSGERRDAAFCPFSPASAGIVTPPSVIRIPSKFATLGMKSKRRRWI